jgi:formyltetrahydrofolate synthetase
MWAGFQSAGSQLMSSHSHLNTNAGTKGAAAGGNLSQVPPLEKGES